MNSENSKTRIIALAFLVCILTVSIFANVFILSHAEHEHDYDGVSGGCVTCERLMNAENIGKQLGMVLAGALVVVGKLLFDTKAVQAVVIYVLPITPVGLKTRMNN